MCRSYPLDHSAPLVWMNHKLLELTGNITGITSKNNQAYAQTESLAIKYTEENSQVAAGTYVYTDGPANNSGVNGKKGVGVFLLVLNNKEHRKLSLAISNR